MTIAVIGDILLKLIIIKKGGTIYPPYFFMVQKFGWPIIVISQLILIFIITLFNSILISLIIAIGACWMFFNDLENLKETPIDSNVA
jgi:hypothetical protein